MKSINKREIIYNNLFYILPSFLLYISLYIIITLQIKGFYKPFFGILFFSFAVFIDYIFFRKKIRIIIRFLFIIFVYLIFKFFIILLSTLTAPQEGYHLIVDKIPYLFNRDTIVIVLFITFYFIFDAIRIIRVNIWGYIISTFILIISFV